MIQIKDVMTLGNMIGTDLDKKGHCPEMMRRGRRMIETGHQSIVKVGKSHLRSLHVIRETKKRGIEEGPRRGGVP
jgi:hypothetical protein